MRDFVQKGLTGVNKTAHFRCRSYQQCVDVGKLSFKINTLHRGGVRGMGASPYHSQKAIGRWLINIMDGLLNEPTGTGLGTRA